MGLLSLLLWTPALGTLILAITPNCNKRIIWLIANLFGLLTLLLSCYLVFQYDSQNPSVQYSEQLLPDLPPGGAYSLGVDGLSITLQVLTTLLTTTVLLAPPANTVRPKAYNICLLLLEFGILGVFLAENWTLFYFFWEVTFVVLYFLIFNHGDQRQQAASSKFMLYMMGGSVFMLMSLLALARYSLEHGGSLTVGLQQSTGEMPLSGQILILFGFLLGFGVSFPIFPLHGWLPAAQAIASGRVNALFSGLILNMSAYGLLRVIVMFPKAVQLLQPSLALLAMLGILYGGLLAWRQSNLKTMLAYASLSHMGTVLLGIACLNEAGINGALLQITAHTLIFGVLFLLVSQLYERTGTWHILDYSPLIQIMPRFALLMILALFAATGLPGSIAFIGGLNILLGCFKLWPWLWLFFGVGSLITAAYAIRTLSLLFLGTATKPAMHQLNDLRPLELVASGILVFGIIWFGFAPSPLMTLSELTVKQFSNILHQPQLKN